MLYDGNGKIFSEKQVPRSSFACVEFSREYFISKLTFDLP